MRAKARCRNAAASVCFKKPTEVTALNNIDNADDKLVCVRFVTICGNAFETYTDLSESEVIANAMYFAEKANVVDVYAVSAAGKVQWFKNCGRMM